MAAKRKTQLEKDLNALLAVNGKARLEIDHINHQVRLRVVWLKSDTETEVLVEGQGDDLPSAVTACQGR